MAYEIPAEFLLIVLLEPAALLKAFCRSLLHNFITVNREPPQKNGTAIMNEYRLRYLNLDRYLSNMLAAQNELRADRVNSEW